MKINAARNGLMLFLMYSQRRTYSTDVLRGETRRLARRFARWPLRPAKRDFEDREDRTGLLFAGVLHNSHRASIQMQCLTLTFRDEKLQYEVCVNFS
jgi:hypothetical protein